MRIGRRAEDIDRNILEPSLYLVLKISLDGRTDMTVHASYLFMRGSHPTVVRRLDVVAARAELGMTGQRNGDSPKDHCAGDNCPDNNGLGLTDHAWGT